MKFFSLSTGTVFFPSLLSGIPVLPSSSSCSATCNTCQNETPRLRLSRRLHLSRSNSDLFVNSPRCLLASWLVRHPHHLQYRLLLKSFSLSEAQMNTNNYYCITFTQWASQRGRILICHNHVNIIKTSTNTSKETVKQHEVSASNILERHFGSDQVFTCWSEGVWGQFEDCLIVPQVSYLQKQITTEISGI